MQAYKSTFRQFFLLLLITLFGFSVAKAQGNWAINKAKTSVDFSIKNLGITVDGKFTEYDGKINFDKSNLQSSKLEFSVKTKTVETKSKGRDAHLREKEFFDVDNFPEMSFSSTKIEKKTDNEYLIQGKLTIKGIKKLISMTMIVKEEAKVNNKQVLSLLFTTILSRKDFGVGSEDFAAKLSLSDKVLVSIPMQLTK